MSDVDVTNVRHQLEMARDACSRAIDGWEQLPGGGITSVTYVARQVALALRSMAAATDILMQEVGR